MPHTLLLADSSLAIHRVVELTFAGQPIDVVAVRDGAAAVAHLEAAPPDIILADIAMPAPTGYDIAAHVKRTPRLAAIPVVLLTGAFEPVDDARARASGCDGVLAKPFDPEIVVRRVYALLNRQGGGPGAEAGASSQPAENAEDSEEEEAPPTLSSLVGAVGSARPGADTPAGPDESRGGADSPAASLNTYFEKLDQSLTTLRTPATPPVERPVAPAPPVSAPVEPAVPARVEVDSKPPSLAEAFAALMEAERWSLRERTATSAGPVAPPMDAADTSGVARAIAHAARQLVEQGGRDAVREIVSQVAERLIREEIERIKAEVEKEGIN